MKKICPIASVYVRAHAKIINGKKHLWKAHCRKIKHRKHVLNGDEIKEIYDQNSKAKLKYPKSYNFRAANGTKYDHLIAFWVEYWRRTFGIDSNITSGFVKTLMMSESTFGKSATTKTHNRSGNAIGLLQITDYTLKLIQVDSSEMRDHRFKIKRDDLFDPVVNVAVAVRWLYRKREIAKYYLKKEPSFLQLAEEYKGIRNDKSVNASKQREAFTKLWKEYQNAK